VFSSTNVARPYARRVRVLRLETVDAIVAFDLPDAPRSAGGTRLASDVTEREGRLLARAMTYKYAVLGIRVGGAKGLVRARPENAATAMTRYCTEIRPLIASGRFATGADLGTSERDFAPLRPPGWDAHVLNSLVDGVPFEDVLTGYGVVAAAEAALGGLEGRTVAVEGLGKVGGGVVREVARRGGRLVAVSTIDGAVLDPAGLDPDQLLAARAEHGDALVAHVGRDVLPTDALFEAPVDVLVPGARTGVLDGDRAARVAAGSVIPAANVPYTADGLATLRARGIAAHADFVCNAAAVVGYWARPDTPQQDVLDHIEGVVTERVEATRDAAEGPFAAACRLADEFLATWCEPDARPDGLPLA
jgi:glutamate dehydrogenase (NAD(P)+)